MMERDGLIIEELSDYSLDNEEDGHSNTIQPNEIESAGLDQSEPEGQPKTNSSSETNLIDETFQENMRQHRVYDWQEQVSILNMGLRAVSERSNGDHKDVQRRPDSDEGATRAHRPRKRIGIQQNLMFQNPPQPVPVTSSLADGLAVTPGNPESEQDLRRNAGEEYIPAGFLNVSDPNTGLYLLNNSYQYSSEAGPYYD